MSQHEIADYAEMLADHFDIRKHIKFSYEVTELKYLKNGNWRIEAKNLKIDNQIEHFEAKHVVCANGPPVFPAHARTRRHGIIFR